MKNKVKIVKKNPEDEEIPLEIMQDSIISLSKFGQQINKTRLGRRAILLLLKDATGVSFFDTGKILDALPELEKIYLK